ncbi:hypothetical protein [Sulfurimonas sp. CS5]|uniref:hypothetical protein n=1 Tax=Sulfurimonas sp. CS5 TaxID=3391145 RepID=UPI0039EAF4A7
MFRLLCVNVPSDAWNILGRMATWKEPTNQVEFSNCFKEYMNSGTTAAGLAIVECQRKAQ